MVVFASTVEERIVVGHRAEGASTVEGHMVVGHITEVAYPEEGHMVVGKVGNLVAFASTVEGHLVVGHMAAGIYTVGVDIEIGHMAEGAYTVKGQWRDPWWRDMWCGGIHKAGTHCIGYIGTCTKVWLILYVPNIRIQRTCKISNLNKAQMRLTTVIYIIMETSAPLF
jgi:hypothetical protein